MLWMMSDDSRLSLTRLFMDSRKSFENRLDCPRTGECRNDVRTSELTLVAPAR